LSDMARAACRQRAGSAGFRQPIKCPRDAWPVRPSECQDGDGSGRGALHSHRSIGSLTAAESTDHRHFRRFARRQTSLKGHVHPEQETVSMFGV
jgi:hypothetical protein